MWAGISDYYNVPVPERYNYDFLGYYTSADGGTQVYNANGYCTNEGSYWSSNTYVHGSGGTLYAHWKIKFIYAESVTLDKTSMVLTLGDTGALSATVLPTNATNRNVNWRSSNTQVAIVENGSVEAVGCGSATVTAETQDGTQLIAECAVTVQPVYVETIEITCEEDLPMVECGQFIALTANVLPGNATDPSVSWESGDETVAIVYQDGLVKGISVGTAVIRALARDGSGVSGQFTVTVTPVVDEFGFDQYSVTLASEGVGSRYPVKYHIVPADKASSIVWSSSVPEVAVVDANGAVTAKNAGRTVISGEIPYGPSDSCIVYVDDDLSLVTLPADLESIEEEAFSGISADRVVIRDACTSIGSKAFADTGIKYILVPGTVTRIAADAFAGSAQICLVCSSGSAAESFAIENGISYIIDNDAAYVSVRAVSIPAALSLEIEDSAALDAAVYPTNASNPALLWSSSNEDVATVSGEGVVTGINPGSAIITALAADGSGHSASCQVTVTLPNVTVSSTSNVAFQTGTEVSAQLEAVITVSGASAGSIQQAGILLYDADGQRIGLSMGEPSGEGAGLSYSCNTKTDMNAALAPLTDYRWRCAVIVKGMAFYSDYETFTTPALPPRIVLNESSLFIEVGDTMTLNAVILNTDETEVRWRSSNSGVVTVLDGDIVAKAAGKATITVILLSDSSVTATCEVTVTAKSSNNPTYTLSLSVSELTLTRGETEKLEAVISPPPLASTVQWSTSNPAAAVVDGSGTVTALSAGSAVICARVNELDLEAYCSVNVAPRMVESITLSADSLSLQVGNTYQLQAEALPVSADDRSVVWASSQPDIVSVENGSIVALAAGTAVISASAADGSGCSGACAVVVSNPPEECGCSGKYAGIYTVIEAGEAGLAVSSGHGPADLTGNTELGRIPEGAEVYVSRASGPARKKGYWAHVTYDGISGYCPMANLTPRVVENVVENKLQAVINKANAWVDFTWTAPVDIPVYNNIYLSHDAPDQVEFAYQKKLWYRAGTVMHGVPYTLASGCKCSLDAYSGLSAANKGAEAEFTYLTYRMWGPRYGGDCMCLVNDALCAGDPTLPHNGNIPNGEYLHLYCYPSWDQLAPGDILITDYHSRIVIAVSGENVTIVETRGNVNGKGAVNCTDPTPREAGGWYVCGVCEYCSGSMKCGPERHTVSKASLQQEGYTVLRYKMLYSDN